MYRSIIASARRTKGYRGVRDEALTRLLFQLGVRCSEVVSILVEDVVGLYNGNAELVIHGKGNKERRLQMPSQVHNALAAWMLVRQKIVRNGNCRHLFVTDVRRPRGIGCQTVTHVLANASKSIGVKVRPHDARAFAIQNSVFSGMNMQNTMQMSGHSQISTVQIYTRNARDPNLTQKIDLLNLKG